MNGGDRVVTTVGQELRRLREERGMSQCRVARMLDCYPSEVSRWESGERTPRLTNLARLDAVLCLTDTELAYLVRLAQWEDPS